ncbi:MAG: hypothetical protein EA001_07015 [Oscillatoriales cyanobacterium]|nr:MAG: hypothetical protein EA001_07015 [Oscillatoriales cyanobacterium]
MAVAAERQPLLTIRSISQRSTFPGDPHFPVIHISHRDRCESFDSAQSDSAQSDSAQSDPDQSDSAQSDPA